MTGVDDELINNSLDDVIVLLEREIERLKESLETIRLSSHPDRAQLIRWHIRTLDERQDALEQMKQLIAGNPRDPNLH
jgi:branched-subunit amino acid aminotransferase/4-amino-4-deoxychorismate lyase